MKHLKIHQSAILTGTLLLTISGVLSRVIGFFYRIFLSRTIGAEGLGIYQLIFPILALSIALTSSGIQTSISRFVAAERATGQKNAGVRHLYSGLILSLSLSLVTFLILTCRADDIALLFLGEPRCAPLLRIMAYSIPAAAVHSCINGYYYGLKSAGLPSITQLIEQLVRVGSVYIIYLICTENHQEITSAAAVWGVVLGEFASALVSVTVIGIRRFSGNLITAFMELTRFCIPLTANRVTINLFSSVEAVLIPMQLKSFGYSSTDALRIFGILTGMAMPMILFPNVLTNSLSVLLLPTISEAQANHNRRLILSAIKKTIEYCLILGLLSTFAFLLTGSFIGRVVFQNTLAGTFIVTLCWICPFINLSSTLGSILHGLGKVTLAFLLNLGGCLIRILCISLFVPRYGIRCYLYSMLVSQLFISGCSLLYLYTHAGRVDHA